MKKESKKLLYIILAILATFIAISVICYDDTKDRVEDFTNHSEIK